MAETQLNGYLFNNIYSSQSSESWPFIILPSAQGLTICREKREGGGVDDLLRRNNLKGDNIWEGFIWRRYYLRGENISEGLI